MLGGLLKVKQVVNGDTGVQCRHRRTLLLHIIATVCRTHPAGSFPFCWTPVPHPISLLLGRPPAYRRCSRVCHWDPV